MRVRGVEWFEHVGVEPELRTYLGTPDTSARTLGRHPVRVARAELALRTRETLSTRSLFLLRNATPLSNGAVEARLLRSAAHGVYDFDDALMIQQAGVVAGIFSRARVWRRAVEAADVVIAGNDYLADAASAHSSNVTMIPTCVEPDGYRVKTRYEIGDPARAVWLGSPTTEVYLRAIAPALLAEHRRSGLRLTVISAGAAALDGLEIMADRVPWRPGVAEERLASADFGLMPLTDGPWERGKCAYKLLQYAAAGLPVIGSPVGVNREVIERFEGLGPTTESEWADALESMVSEPASARAGRGRAARDAVTEHYSFRRWAEPWQAAVLPGR
jgi:glycosyltransferase involved in cell wall biosynthesis